MKGSKFFSLRYGMLTLKRFEKRAKVALARCVALFVRPGRIEPGELLGRRIERLLVIRQHNQMGDMLLAVPAFRGLRKRFPDARITLLAASINTDVMLNSPYLDEVLTYAKERHAMRPLVLFRFIRTLRRSRYDAVIVLSTVSFSITSMLLALVCGAPIRIGSTSAPFGHDLAGRFYHLELPLPSAVQLETMHETEHNLFPLALVDVHEDNLSSCLIPRAEEEHDCERFVAAAVPREGSFAVIHPGAGKRQNIWPAARFAAVMRGLRDRFALESIVVRGPVDGAAVDGLIAEGTMPSAILSCPSPGFLGALLRRASLVVCNDTGVMHIAGAVDARCVAVFGPTDPARWKPVGDRVVAVRAPDGLVSSVRVEDVLEAAARLLRESEGNE